MMTEVMEITVALGITFSGLLVSSVRQNIHCLKEH